MAQSVLLYYRVVTVWQSLCCVMVTRTAWMGLMSWTVLITTIITVRIKLKILT